MRPEEAHRLVRNALKPFYSRNEYLYPALRKLKQSRTIKAVDQMLELAIKDAGEDSGCYYENTLTNPESVLNSLFYISDRWNCVGRLKYLKRVIELY